MNRGYIPFATVNEPRDIIRPNETYSAFATRETCLTREELWISWVVNHGVAGSINAPNGTAYDLCLEDNTAAGFYESFADSIRNDWDAYEKTYDVRKEQLLEAAERLGTAKTRQAFEKYVEAAYVYAEYIWSPWAVIHVIEPEVCAALGEHIDVIIALEKPVAYQDMIRALHTQPLGRVAEEYSWLKISSLYDHQYTVEELDAIKSENDENPERARFAEARERFARTIRNVRDERLRRDAMIMHTFAWLKTDRMDTWKRAMKEIRPFYEHLASLAGCTLKEAANLTVKEALSILQGGSVPDQLSLRAEGEVLYGIRRGTINIVSDVESIREVRALLDKYHRGNDVQGTVASRGKATGVAKIVLDTRALEKIKEGDIMIARHTFPPYTPYMAKCAGIVADEGGLTNHTAVISRELGTPCIVGTKNATKTFKDGDMLEVDADKGTVRRVG